MADDIIQLPADGTGKKVDNESLTVGANTVYRQRMRIAGLAATDLVGADAANGLDVDVTRLPALVAGTANIGDVDVLTVITGTGATNLGKAEDAGHTTGDTGVMLLGVANEAHASLSDTTLDYTPLAVTRSGFMMATQMGGFKTTYSATSLNIATVATPTDVFTITGTATKTVRVTKIVMSGTQTTAGVISVRLIKRSTANTGGTSAAATAVAHDSNNAAATATVLSYTVNPTPGTAVGDVRSEKYLVPAPATVGGTALIWDFGDQSGQHVVLRGIAQVLAINLNSVTLTGGSLTFYVEWTEE